MHLIRSIGMYFYITLGRKHSSKNMFKKKKCQWIKELRVLCKIAWCEPQAAYSGFIKRFKNKPIYFMRTIPNTKNQLEQLDDFIRTEFIPAITGEINCSDIKRRLLFLLPRFLRPWNSNILVSAQKEYEFSTILSKDLTTNIINQQSQCETNNNAKKIKREIELTKMQHYNKNYRKYDLP